MTDASGARVPVASSRAAVTGVFALNGALFASVYSRLPAIRDELDLGDGELGLALLCGMVGLMLSQPVAGALVARRGSRPVVLVGGLGYALGIVPVALAPSLVALALAFALLGLLAGLLDVSMNVHGLTVERARGRPILSTLHAAFSFGALGGAVVGAAAAAAGVDPVAQFCVLAGMAAVAIVGLHRLLLPSTADASPIGHRLARPSRGLAALGALAFCVLLAEGAVADWGAVLLSSELGAREGVAALALASFSLAMGVGRLAGDRLVGMVGAVSLARAGAVLASAGIAVALAPGEPLAAIAGLGLMGLGLSSVFPLALRAAAAGSPAPGPAVAAVSASGYLGLLAGPPAIGALAELGSLRSALVLVAALCVASALLAGATRVPRGASGPAGPVSHVPLRGAVVTDSRAGP